MRRPLADIRFAWGWRLMSFSSPAKI